MQEAKSYNELIEKFMDACYANIRSRNCKFAEIFLSYSPVVNRYYILFKMNDDNENQFIFTINQAKRLVAGLSESVQYINDDGLVEFVRGLIRVFIMCLDDYKIMVVQRH